MANAGKNHVGVRSVGYSAIEGFSGTRSRTFQLGRMRHKFEMTHELRHPSA